MEKGLQTVQAVDFFGTRPKKQHPGDAGFDLESGETDNLVIDPGCREFVRTGTWVRIPANNVGLVCPRSGLAINHGITVLNAPGVIDSSFRGEVKVILFNASDTPYIVAPGERIAQLLIVPLLRHVIFDYDPDFTDEDSPRGSGGFGSTGYGGNAA